jgi:hypothetical protein
MGRRQKNNSTDLPSRFEDERFFEDAFALLRHLGLFGWFPKAIEPEPVPGIGNQRPGNASAHAVADDHHLLVQPILLFNGIQLLAEDERAVWVRVAAWVANPDISSWGKR